MTGRTIPVTRSDGSEVAGEATQALIHDQLDLKSSEVVADLRGAGGKTLTDLWNELASTLAVSDSTSHTTLASILTALGPLATDSRLEAVRALLAGTLAVSATSLPLPSGAATDVKLEAVRALLAGTLAVSAASLPLPSGAATDAKLEAVRALLAGILTVGGATADGATPAAGVYSVMAGGKDVNGNKRTNLLDASNRQVVVSPDSVQQDMTFSGAADTVVVDMTNYQSFAIQFTSAGTGNTFVIETQEDNTASWVQMYTQAGQSVGITGWWGSISISTYPYITGTRRGRWLRIRPAVFGTGPVVGKLTLQAVQMVGSPGVIAMGTNAENLSVTGNPVSIALEGRTSSKNSVGNASVVRPIGTPDGRQVVRPNSIPENEWSYAAALGGISNTTSAVTIKAAAGASVRNYITSIQIMSEALTNATELAIRDGAAGTVLWRTKIGTGGLPLVNVKFDDPLKGTANTLLEVVTLTASGTGAVYFNAQGYIGP